MSAINKEIPRLVFGTDRLGETKKKEGFRILDDAFSLGIRVFDTAAVYMDNAEGVFYQWIADRGIREEAAMRGYLYEENMERLRRAEQLAGQLDVTAAQIALAWVFRQGLDVYALVSAGSRKHMEENLRALEIALTPEQCQWLNLEKNEL